MHGGLTEIALQRLDDAPISSSAADGIQYCKKVEKVEPPRLRARHLAVAIVILALAGAAVVAVVSRASIAVDKPLWSCVHVALPDTRACCRAQRIRGADVAFHNSPHGAAVLPESIIGACRLNVSDETWVTHTIGPFETSGGGAGVKFVVYNMSSWAGDVYITGSQLRPVDTAGVILPFPPLHEHHMHVGTSRAGERLSPADSQMLSKNGDFAAYRDNATIDYRPFHLAIPAGHWLNVDAFLWDVRPARSPPLRWSYEISIRVAGPGLTPLASPQLPAPGP